MSMRDIHFGVKLDFNTPEECEDSEDVLLRLLGVNCRMNKAYLRKNPKTPLLYKSGITYAPPDQLDGRPPLTPARAKKLIKVLKEIGSDPETARMVLEMVRGMEIFLDIPGLYRRGKGDCNELVPVRVAELWMEGRAASPYLVKERNNRGGFTYHAIVLHPDGSHEDPSMILGMGGKSHEHLRKQEIYKNVLRWDDAMTDALELVQQGAMSPDAAMQHVEMLGYLPSNETMRLVRQAA